MKYIVTYNTKYNSFKRATVEAESAKEAQIVVRRENFDVDKIIGVQKELRRE